MCSRVQAGCWECAVVTVKLLNYTRDGERLVAAAAKQTIKRKPVDPWSLSEEEIEKWIIETFRRQHWSPWEFSTYTFLVDGCSRVCSHQLVRHRHASYAQLSMRYSEGKLRDLALTACELLGVKCPEKPRRKTDYAVYAEALDRLVESNLPLVSIAEIAYVIPPTLNDESKNTIAMEYIRATATYYRLLSEGAQREDARFTIPSAIKTTIYVSMNARELVTVFLPLRMCTKAQWEIRRLAWALWRELVKVHPRLFKYAGPRCVLAENTVRDKPAPLEAFLSGQEKFTIVRCPELVPQRGIPACLKFASTL